MRLTAISRDAIPMTVTQASLYLGVGVTTIHYFINSGRLVASQTGRNWPGGRQWLIEQAEVQRFAAQMQRRMLRHTRRAEGVTS